MPGGDRLYIRKNFSSIFRLVWFGLNNSDRGSMLEMSEIGAKSAARVLDDPIKEFYHGRDIFVTGGSGLMGKALLEKLLRTCFSVNKIFVLLRGARGKEGNDRLEEVKSSKIFDRLRIENPSVLDKLEAIPGDIAELGLGMSEESKKKMERVSLVFHVAATVRFDEPLKRAIMLNLRATHEAIKFAMELKHLTRFIHVSTAYCYPYRSRLEEEVYPAMADWRVIIKMAEKFEDDILNALTHKILDVFPNTYTFTKHLAEHVCKDYCDKLPIAIMRPTIVHCCGTEPMAGWYDKILAVMGMMTGASTGIIRAVYCRPSCILDLIPLDVCTKIFIISAWWIDKAEKHLTLPVFNLSACQVRNHSIETLVRTHTEVLEEYPFNKMLWIPEYGLTDNIYIFYFRIYVFHVLPAMFLDLLIKLSGRKPFLLHVQRRSISSQRALKFFMFNDYTFLTKRFMVLLEALKDYSDFKFDDLNSKTLHDIVVLSSLGCRRYLIKEDDESLPRAVKRYKIIKWLDFVICKGFKCWVVYYVIKQIAYMIENQNMLLD